MSLITEKILDTVEMTLNMGPQHPATHGVLRLVLKINGELITEADPVIGYLHRGIEKLGEYRKFAQFIPFTDRLDYVMAPNNNIAYCMTVEKLLGIRIPERAEFMRVILLELTRLVSHLVWLGTHALDIGAFTVLMYTFREREKILDLFEEYCGARLTTSLCRIGGLPYDFSPIFIEKLEKLMEEMPSFIDDYETLLTNNRIWLKRLKNVGVITREEAIDYCLSGPVARGSGVNWDLRRDNPYSVYDKFDFFVPVYYNGDSYDRYRVRIREMRESVKIIRQALKMMPKGDFIIDDFRYAIPPREKFSNTIEGMVHLFNWVIKGIQPPVGEVYHAVESPKGELGFYIVSDGSPYPVRLRIRSSSFVNLRSLTKMVKNRPTLIADMVTIIGSLDIVLGEIDR